MERVIFKWPAGKFSQDERQTDLPTFFRDNQIDKKAEDILPDQKAFWSTAASIVMMLGIEGKPESVSEASIALFYSLFLRVLRLDKSFKRLENFKLLPEFNTRLNERPAKSRVNTEQENFLFEKEEDEIEEEEKEEVVDPFKYEVEEEETEEEENGEKKKRPDLLLGLYSNNNDLLFTQCPRVIIEFKQMIDRIDGSQKKAEKQLEEYLRIFWFADYPQPNHPYLFGILLDLNQAKISLIQKGKYKAYKDYNWKWESVYSHLTHGQETAKEGSNELSFYHFFADLVRMLTLPYMKPLIYKKSFLKFFD